MSDKTAEEKAALYDYLIRVGYVSPETCADRIADATADLTAQLQAAQAAIKAHNDGLISDCYDIAIDTSALAEVKAEALDGFAALLRDRYPEDVFPKPSKDDYANLHVALKVRGVTLDRISADMLRRAGAQAEREATEIRAASIEQTEADR